MENLYAIYDRKAESYGAPFSCITDGCAVRILDSLLVQDSQKIGKYPEDFDLVRLGSFDPCSGSVSSSPISVVTSAIERITYYRALQAMRENITNPCPDQSEKEVDDAAEI